MAILSIQSRLDVRERNVYEARQAFFSDKKTKKGNKVQLKKELSLSWQRCSKNQIKSTSNQPQGEIYSSQQLNQSLEKNSLLINCASSMLRQLYEQISNTGCLILLSDNQGLVLKSYGDASFSPTAQNVSLKPGAIWHENSRGTNAIGTALIAKKPIEVWGGEHYIKANDILTCSAAPIINSMNEVIGVVDISSERFNYHPHTLALVTLASQNIERRLFFAQYANQLIFSFHHNHEYLGGVYEGLLAFGLDGEFLAMNQLGHNILGHKKSNGNLVWENLVETSFEYFVNRVFSDPKAVHVVTVHNDCNLFFQYRGELPNNYNTHKFTGISKIDVKASSSTNSLKCLEKNIIQKTLTEMDGNISATARKLRISRNKIYRKLNYINTAPK